MEKASEKKRGLGGQITVFVSMILMLLFAFLCVLMESARTAGARWYLQMAASSSMDSVFSQYHRELWDRYRLLFAEYETGAEMEADFAGFLLPYLETDNWYPMALEAVSAEEIVRAVDGHGAYLEKEILDYMKYGIWNLDFEGDAVENLWKQEREAEAVTEMAQTYRTRTRDVWKLERVLESISENLNRQRNERQQGLNALSSYDGAGFRRAAEQMIGALKKMPGLVKQYEKEADRLAETLQADRREQEARTDRLGTDMAAALEQEIQQTGFQNVNGATYYFDPSNGVMVAGTTKTISGVSYTFNADGTCTTTLSGIPSHTTGSESSSQQNQQSSQTSAADDENGRQNVVVAGSSRS